MTPIRTLIVAATTLEADLLRSSLSAQPGLDVVQVVTDLDELLDHLRECDVVVLNASAGLPPHQIIGLVRQIRETRPNVHVVVARAPDLPQEVVPYLEAGATGYVRGGDSLTQLVRVIRTVHEGAALIDPEVARYLIEHLSNIRQRLAASFDSDELIDEQTLGLTERQLEVLELISKGMSNQEIADELFIEIGTVKNHVHNILKTLGVEDRAQAASWYLQHAALHQSPEGATGSLPGDSGGKQDSGAVEGLRRALEELALRFGWPVGHIWTFDPETGTLRSTQVWAVDDLDIRRPFIEATEATSFKRERGQGIIGHVFETREPVWSARIVDEADFLRAEGARAAGLRAGLLIPLIAGDQFVGVMEFYSSTLNVPEPDIVIEGATELSWRILTLRQDPNLSSRSQ